MPPFRIHHLSRPAIQALILAVLACATTPPSSGETPSSPSIQSTAPRYLGVSSCASSNCHGSSRPRETSPVLQNEFFSWYKKDEHSKAYKSLLTPEAKRMAFHLGLGAPEKEHRCLNCHATNAPAHLQGERFALSDGVGCESCHGAADGWIKAHVEKGATHQSNIANGLRDLDSPVARASLCIDCHGVTGKNGLDHTLYGAGHPRIEFELDSYQAVMPRHWREDDDYRARKSTVSRTTAWLLGQYTLAKNVTKLAKAQGNSPDFSLYQCYSCHHDFSEKQFLWKNYRGTPGKPPLNDAAIDILATTLNRPATQLDHSLDTVRRELEEDAISARQKGEMLRSLLISLTRPADFSLQYVEQAIMGVSVLLSELDADPAIASMTPQERALYKEVESSRTVNPDRVRELALQALKTIGKR